MNRIILGGIVTVIAGLILAATAWNFSAVASMPEEYVKRAPHTEQHQRIENKLDKIYEILMGRPR